MPRPRSRDKVVPVSIGIPVSLMMRLDNELSWQQSRSKWVKKAIESKLLDTKNFAIDDISNIRLVNIFHARMCGCQYADSCVDYKILKSMMRVEETVKEQ